MEELDETLTQAPPIWAVFGDLMTGLVGVLVILLVWILGFQVELSQNLKKEIEKRKMEEQRRITLEKALADPLAQGRITLRDGRIGISGNVLFSLNSATLQPEGRELLRTLVGPLKLYLDEHDELLMISGFTDNLPIHEDNLQFEDNWDLSAKRALTVTRALVEEGMPPNLVFAAAFGEYQPITPNLDKAGQSQNRRVEIAPVPRSKTGGVNQ